MGIQCLPARLIRLDSPLDQLPGPVFSSLRDALCVLCAGGLSGHICKLLRSAWFHESGDIPSLSKSVVQAVSLVSAQCNLNWLGGIYGRGLTSLFSSPVSYSGCRLMRLE